MIWLSIICLVISLISYSAKEYDWSRHFTIMALIFLVLAK
jgi:hypothetical protein